MLLIEEFARRYVKQEDHQTLLASNPALVKILSEISNTVATDAQHLLNISLSLSLSRSRS